MTTVTYHKGKPQKLKVSTRIFGKERKPSLQTDSFVLQVSYCRQIFLMTMFSEYRVLVDCSTSTPQLLLSILRSLSLLRRGSYYIEKRQLGEEKMGARGAKRKKAARFSFLPSLPFPRALNLVPRGCIPFGQHQGYKTSGRQN